MSATNWKGRPVLHGIDSEGAIGDAVTLEQFEFFCLSGYVVLREAGSGLRIRLPFG